MILDRLYRLLLRFLPSRFDHRDRREMWGTYQARVQAARVRSGVLAAQVERLRELADLVVAGLRTRGGADHLDALRQDLSMGLRSLLRTPLTTLAAVLSLALGIGATSAVFGALDVWLLRPLPVDNGERLVGVGMANVQEGWGYNAFSVRDFVDWRREARGVELAAYRRSSLNVDAGGRTRRIDALQVSHDLTRILGVTPTLGRSFAPDEATAGGARVAMVSHGFWQGTLSGDPGVVDSKIFLDGVPYTVIGVLPKDRWIPGVAGEVWIPLRVSGNEARDNHMLSVVGLLGSGVSMTRARDELQAVASRVVVQDPEATFPDAAVLPFRDVVYGPEFEQGGLVLGGAVLFVLLVACANVANLLLARGFSRSHEMAVRGALGAGRGRLVRQLMTENLLLAVLGGAAGLAVGALGIDLLRSFVLPPDIPGWNQISLDGRVLVAALIMTVGSTLLFGLAPALHTARIDLRGQLAEGGKDAGPVGGSRLRSGLVVGEIAAVMALLTLAALLIRDLAVANSMGMDMRTDGAVVFRISVPAASHPGMDETLALFDRMSREVGSLPGVDGVAWTTGTPLGTWSTTLYTVEGTEPSSDPPRRSAESRRVSPSYARVMELPLVAGRWLDPEDDENSPRVAVVSRVLAEQWWEQPSHAPGQRIVMDDVPMEVVGVVEAGRLRGPTRQPPPVIFESFRQRPSRFAFFVVPHSGDTGRLVTRIRDRIRQVDPSLAAFNVTTLKEVRKLVLGPQIAGLRVFSALGAVALLLTLVGVYGVMSSAVGERMREMGLRMALGASSSRLVRMVLVRSGRLALMGLAAGILLSLGAGQALAFLLVGVSPRDPLVLSVVPVLVLGAVLAASYLPARRVSRADPVRTLRGE